MRLRLGQPLRLCAWKLASRAGEFLEQRRDALARKRLQVEKPPANEITSGLPSSANTEAIPSPTSPRVRAAKGA